MNDAGRIGFVMKGDYDNTAIYDFLDVVYYGSSSYVAKKLTTGNLPENNSEYWQVLAATPDSVVTGVKGAEESQFRIGNVVLTPENIGALKKEDLYPENIVNNGTGGFSAGTGLQLETYKVMEAEFTCTITKAGPDIVEIEYDSGYGPMLTAYGFLVSVNSQEGPSGYLDGYEGQFLGNDKDVDFSNTSYGTETSAFTGAFIRNGEIYFCYESEDSAQYILNNTAGSCVIEVGTRHTNICDNQNVFGTYNNHNFRNDSALVIGAGSNATGAGRKNALRLTKNSALYLGAGGAYNSSGADHAEFVKEWADGNPDNEDRIGYFVTVKDGLLYKAGTEDYISGITSGNPCVVGNADEEYYWRYERDEFNRLVMETVPEEVQETDKEGSPVFDDAGEPVMIKTGRMVEVPKVSENYDPSRPYTPRKDRPEWDYVGMLGVLPVRDDGTCVPGRFCKCGSGGIATLAEERGFDTFFVLERIAPDVVSVELRGI